MLMQYLINYGVGPLEFVQWSTLHGGQHLFCVDVANSEGLVIVDVRTQQQFNQIMNNNNNDKMWYLLNELNYSRAPKA